MTNVNLVLDYLRSIAPRSATNAEISKATGVTPHQQVFQKTQALSEQKLIGRKLLGKQWSFFYTQPRNSSLTDGTLSAIDRPDAVASLGSVRFELLAIDIMSKHYRSDLRERKVDRTGKKFDLVSIDQQIVGDAKYYTLVHGRGMPPAKFAPIAEYVWLLEKTGAGTQFLVFGNQREVPELWLRKYGNLLQSTEFFFLRDDGSLEQLWPRPDAARVLPILQLPAICT